MGTFVAQFTWRTLHVLLLGLLLSACGGGGGSSPAPNIVLERVSITAVAVLPAGVTHQLVIEGDYSDGSRDTVSGDIQWSSADESILTVSSGGLVTAVAEGVAEVSVQVDGLSAVLSVTVGPAALVSVDVSLSSPVVVLGRSISLVAIAHYSDLTQNDVSSVVAWTSADEAVATVDAAGRVSSHSVGTVSVSALYGGISVTHGVEVVAAELESLVLSDLAPSLALGRSLQLSVTGHYSDSTQVDLTSEVLWASDNLLLASVDGGLLQALGEGETFVSASFEGVSTTVNVVISAPVLDVLSVSAADAEVVVGNVLSLSAAGVYSDSVLYQPGEGELDQSLQNLTSIVSWASADSAVASVSDAGVVAGVSAGQTTVTATYSGKSSSFVVDVLPFDAATLAAKLVRLSVSPTQLALVAGLGGQFQAIGVFIDGSQRDVTALVEWTGSLESVASVSNAAQSKGEVDALQVGDVLVTAGVGGFSAQSDLTVLAATLDSIEISPKELSLPLGTNKSLVVTGVYSDGSIYDISDQVVWSSGSALVADFNDALYPSLIDSVGLGLATITAQSVDGLSTATTEITVTDAVISSLTLSSGNASVAAGGVQLLSAIAVYSDNTSADVTNEVIWSSSNTEVAVVDAFGGVTTLAQGVVDITAVYDGQTAVTSLVVTAAELTNIEISPMGAVVAVGGEQVYTATGYYSDGSSGDVTAQVIWQSDNEAEVGASSQGVFSAKAATLAPVRVTASLRGVLAFSTMSVTAATLTSIEVVPSLLSLAAGTEQVVTAMGTYSDGSTRDISAEVVWDSQNPAVFYVSNAQNDQSRGYAVSPGSAGVTASVPGGTGDIVSTAVSFSVSSATLSSISVVAESSVMYVGGYQQMTATGTYSDGSTQDITTEVLWRSADVAVADISNAERSPGIVVGLGASASVVLSAELAGVSGATSVELLVDINIPVALAGAAFPNVILNNGVDSSTVSFLLKPYGDSGVIADGTVVDVRVLDAGVWSSASATTVDGIASISLTSLSAGWLEVYARVPGKTAWAGLGVYSTNDLMSVLDAQDASSLLYDAANSEYLAGTQFSALVKNLSNRVFQVVFFQLLRGEPADPTFLHDDIQMWLNADQSVLSGGFLGRGEIMNVVAGLSRALVLSDPWVRYVLYDPASGTYWHIKMPVGVK